MISEATPSPSCNKRPVIIFGDNITSFGVIRGLRDLHVEIYIVADQGRGIGTYSRYVRDFFVLHPSHPEYVPKIIAWIKKRFTEKPVLIVAGNDDALVLLSKQHNRLSEVAEPAFPSWDVVSKVINKELAYELAREVGIPTIETQRIDSLSDLKAYLGSSINLKFPVFLKSANSRQFSQCFDTKGVICHSESEVLQAYRKYDGFLGALLLQDFLPGDIDNIFAVLMVLNKKSEVIAVFVNEKIRSSKLYGATTLSASMWNQQLVDNAVILAESIGYVGFVGVQFKFDPRDNDYKFLEINGRFSVSASLAQRCGINMPEMVYREFTGESFQRLVEFKQQYPNEILLWRPLSDMSLLAQKQFYQEPLRYLSALVGNGYIVEPFSWKDPLPALFPLIKLSKMLMKKIFSAMQSLLKPFLKM